MKSLAESGEAAEAMRARAEHPESLRHFVFRVARKPVLTAMAIIPIYALAEVALAVLAGALVQLAFFDRPRIRVQELIPGGLRGLIDASQTVDRKDVVVVLPLLLVATGFVKLATGFLSTYLLERGAHRLGHALRGEFLCRYLVADGSELDRRNPSESAVRIASESNAVQAFVSRGSINLLRDGAVLLFAAVAVFLVSAEGALVGLAIVLPAALILRAIAGRLRGFAEGMMERQNRLAERAVRTASGAQAVWAMRAQRREREDLEALARESYSFARGTLALRTLFRPGTEWIAYMAAAGLLAVALAAPTMLAGAGIAPLLILVAISFRPLKNLSAVIGQLSEWRAVWIRVNGFWEALGAARNPAMLRSLDAAVLQPAQAGTHPVALPALGANAIECRGLSLRVSGHPPVLDGIDLFLPRGERIAFVGPSGAGKTTLLRLLAGVLRPSEGSLHLDSPVLLATQVPFVFRASVRENLFYGRADNLDEAEEDAGIVLLLRLRLAVSEAGARLLLERRLGFLGEGFSGGEKARLALARVLLDKPSILLLDEPTANLDAESTSAFWEAVDEWARQDRRRTVVAVSHTPRDLRHWERFVELRGGRVVWQGAPQERELM